MIVTLTRTYEYIGVCQMGIIVADGAPFATLEPPWRGNQRNVSCIPVGDYETYFMKRSASGKYRNVFHVTGVPNRSEILIHGGNTADHTRGCILIGKHSGLLAGNPAVLSSRVALREFDEIVPDKFTLRVL